MKRKIGFDTLLENNTVLLVLSLLAAILVWFTVVSGTDSNIDDTIRNVPVFIDVADSALARLKLEPINESEFSVDVAVAGPRVVVGGIKPADLKVVAKLNNVNGPGTYTLALEGIDANGKGFEIKGTIPETISMRFDHKMKKTLPVKLELSGMEIPDGYLLNEEYVYPAEVTVSGPATEMELVQGAQASLKFDKPLAQTGTFDANVVLLDANGAAVESPYLTIDSPVSSVTLPILKKKIVPVTFDFVNVPRDFDVGTLNYTIKPQTIEIAGPVATINSMTELHLGYIDLRTLEPDTSLSYQAALPPGYISVENVQDIHVTFENSNLQSKVINNVTDIRLINLPPDYSVNKDTKTLYGIQVYGPQTVVANLTAKDVVVQIDMANVDIRIGTVTVPVNILLPGKEDCWAYGDDYKATITISDKK